MNVITQQHWQHYQSALAQYRMDNLVFAIDIGYNAQKLVTVRLHTKQQIGAPPQFFEIVYRPKAIPSPVILPQSPRTQFQNPLRPGISIGYNVAGTLGMFCRDTTGRLLMLTAQHVVTGPKGTPVYQPSLHDGGVQNTDIIGEVIRFDPFGDAVVTSVYGRAIDTRQFGTQTKIATIAKSRLGQVLRKSGRTTGITDGIVDGIGTYFIQKHGYRIPVSVFRLVPDAPGRQVSEGGDSGAIWFDPQTSAGVGLHFTGDTQYNSFEFGFAQELFDVTQKLKINPY